MVLFNSRVLCLYVLYCTYFFVASDSWPCCFRVVIAVGWGIGDSGQIEVETVKNEYSLSKVSDDSSSLQAKLAARVCCVGAKAGLGLSLELTVMQ